MPVLKYEKGKSHASGEIAEITLRIRRMGRLRGHATASGGEKFAIVVNISP
jgi:hypothetical protein